MTNAITNALHSVCLYSYALLSIKYYLDNKAQVSCLVVLFFLLAAAIKTIGILVHYHDAYDNSTSWFILSILSFALNMTILSTLKTSVWLKSLYITISLLCLICSYPDYQAFIYVAVPQLLISMMAACFLAGKARIGFIIVVAGNLIWITLRLAGESFIACPLPKAVRYDNDIYHLILIISSFILYKAITSKDWTFRKLGI